MPQPSAGADRFLVGLGAATRMIRARERLAQVDVARRAGLSPNFVGAIENGRANPTFTRLDQLAQGLGLTGVDELLAIADDAARRLADGAIPPAP